MSRHLIPVALVLLPITALAAEPFDNFTRPWRDDPAWTGGEEVAVYEATRVVDENEVRYEARLTTYKELASPETFTTSDTGEGRAVLRQFLREDVPMPDGVAHFGAMCYVGSDDLKSLKLEFAAIDERGSFFKQYINHAGTLRWAQYSHLAKEGRAEDEFDPPDELVFFNALPTVLRGYPFNDPKEIELAVIDDQFDRNWSNTKPGKYVARYGGRHALDLPIGEIDAHQVMLFFVGPTREFRPPAKFYFAVDPALRHVLLQYEGPAGKKYRLKQLQRPDDDARSE